MPKFDELHPIGGAAEAAARAASNLEKIDKLQPPWSRGLNDPVRSFEWDKIQRNISRIKDEISRQSPLHDSPPKKKAMELQQDSNEYKEFLQLVEESEWIRPNVYEIFYKSSEIRRERLLTAIYNRKIHFQMRDKGNVYEDGAQGVDNDFRLFIEDCYFSNSRSSSDCFVLEAKSFLAWLKEEYPYEGEEQANAEQKENDSAPSLSPKRESNLLKIIGGFVQTVYLQKDTGAYRNGDKPKISAIANAFSEALNTAGYSDEGFKDRKLRETISEALKQIEENKKS